MQDDRPTLVVFRSFFEIKRVMVDGVISLKDLMNPFDCCARPIALKRQEVSIAVLHTPETYQQREEKCSICLDEPNKRTVMLLDDFAGRRFQVLIAREYFHSLTPREFLKVVVDATKTHRIDYTPVEPKLFIPDEPEIPSEFMTLF